MIIPLFATARPTHPRPGCFLRCQASTTTTEAAARPLAVPVVYEVSGGRRRALDGTGQGSQHHHSGTTQPVLEEVEEPTPLHFLKGLFLPRGWPHSVTPDYLEYQLWSVPTHILGWMSHSLATSSMLKAVGIGLGPAGAVGASAAIKWITKDGLGAVGRIFVGGRLSSVFDEDPKRWRMNAEFVNSTGLALEIATQLWPANFIVLAGAGTLTRALSKGMGRPCFRVVQTYFSAANNVGDVAAKEEVWEVVGQLLGLAASVLVLKALEATDQPGQLIVPTWAAVQGAHVLLRYRALAALHFPYPNQRRASMLVTTHLSEGHVPTVEAVGRSENTLLPAAACEPRTVFGCTVQEALAGGLRAGAGGASSSSSGGGGGNGSSGTGGLQQVAAPLESLVSLYEGERYLLTWHSGAAHVLLWEGAAPADYVRALYQAACLQEEAGGGIGGGSGGLTGSKSATLEQLAASLACMRRRWADFEAQAAKQGWLLDKAVVPLGGTLLSQHQHGE